MGRKKAEKSLKETVEEGIMAVLKATEEPSDGRIKALALGIKMCALNAKMEESEYGDYFKDDDESVVPPKLQKQNASPRIPTEEK